MTMLLISYLPGTNASIWQDCVRDFGKRLAIRVISTARTTFTAPMWPHLRWWNVEQLWRQNAHSMFYSQVKYFNLKLSLSFLYWELFCDLPSGRIRFMACSIVGFLEQSVECWALVSFGLLCWDPICNKQSNIQQIWVYYLFCHIW
jgi:hypothetical protein